MKKLIIYSFFIFFSANVFGQLNAYIAELTFNTTNIKLNRNKTIIKVLNGYDNYLNSNPVEILKIKPAGNIIVVRVKLKEPTIANAFLYQNDSLISMSSTFILTNAPINISFNKVTATITGGENQFYEENKWLYLNIPYSIVAEKGYYEMYPKGNYELDKKIYTRLNFKWLEYENNIIKANFKNRYLYFNLISLNAIKDKLSTKTLETCFKQLPIQLKQTTIGNLIESYIKNSKKLFLGELLPKFTVLDSVNKAVHINNLLENKKLIIIDFWASWCAPCREKMKFLSRLYPLLDTSVVSLISISLDESTNNWKNASRVENIVWKNYIDTLGWNGIAQKYLNISSIPFNIILDDTGIIIEKNIWDEKLKIFLEARHLLKIKE